MPALLKLVTFEDALPRFFVLNSLYCTHLQWVCEARGVRPKISQIETHFGRL